MTPILMPKTGCALIFPCLYKTPLLMYRSLKTGNPGIMAGV
jgi:hypothetical protein